jgi:tetratricopeptide (TPR) repeat protein
MKKNTSGVAPLFRGGLDGAVLFARATLLDSRPETTELALRLYREVVRLVPEHVEARNNLGVLCHRLGRASEAMAAWRGALEVDPDHAESHNNMGHVLQLDGKLEAAAVHLLRAVKSDPEMEEARFNLALCLQALGRPKAALEQWRAYLRRWPRSEYAPRIEQHVELCLRALERVTPSGPSAEKPVKRQQKHMIGQNRVGCR